MFANVKKRKLSIACFLIFNPYDEKVFHNSIAACFDGFLR